jgi:hypothetical protein
MEQRLPAHLEVAGLIRRVQAAGGFAAVLNKGERDAGTIMLVLTDKGENPQVYERMPQVDGTRPWCCSRRPETGDSREMSQFIQRRIEQDPDLWVIELDIAEAERFIGLSR